VVNAGAVPIYEYKCAKCGRKFEYMQKMSDPPMKKCEKCGGKLDKLVSAAGFVLKGGGWYKDLYASSKRDGGESASMPAKSEKSESGGEKADKPEKADKAEKKPKQKSSKGR
jgi:putative FmdB family regulatory protein